MYLPRPGPKQGSSTISCRDSRVIGKIRENGLNLLAFECHVQVLTRAGFVPQPTLRITNDTHWCFANRLRETSNFETRVMRFRSLTPELHETGSTLNSNLHCWHQWLFGTGIQESSNTTPDPSFVLKVVSTWIELFWRQIDDIDVLLFFEVSDLPSTYASMDLNAQKCTGSLGHFNGWFRFSTGE